MKVTMTPYSELSPEAQAQLRAEAARQDRLQQHFTQAVAPLVHQTEPPVAIAGMVDMIVAIAAAIPESRDFIQRRMTMLVETVGRMPEEQLTGEQFGAFLESENRRQDAVPPEQHVPSVAANDTAH